MPLTGPLPVNGHFLARSRDQALLHAGHARRPRPRLARQRAGTGPPTRFPHRTPPAFLRRRPRLLADARMASFRRSVPRHRREGGRDVHVPDPGERLAPDGPPAGARRGPPPLHRQEDRLNKHGAEPPCRDRPRRLVV